MREFLKNPFIKFIVLFSVLALIWFTFYYNLYQIDNLFSTETKSFDIQKTISIALGEYSNFFTSLLGYSPKLDSNTTYVITSVEGTYYSHGVWIGEPCNGIKLFGLFGIFIIAFPGPWKKKLWFIPMGILIIHTANAIRIAILTIISAENPRALDFNHNITFQVVVYGLIFLLWYWWVQRLSGLNLTNKEKNNE